MASNSTKALFALGLALTILGGYLFAIFACELIPSYVYAGGFGTTTCTVNNAQFVGNVCCSDTLQDPNCGAPYPCYAVSVTYKQGANLQSALLVNGYVSAIRQGASLTCSYYRCKNLHNYTELRVDAENFYNTYKTNGSSYTCFYNPSRLTEALLYRVGIEALVPALLLPLVSFAIGVIISIMAWKEVGPCKDDYDKLESKKDSQAQLFDMEDVDDKHNNKPDSGVLTVRTTAETDCIPSSKA